MKLDPRRLVAGESVNDGPQRMVDRARPSWLAIAAGLVALVGVIAATMIWL